MRCQCRAGWEATVRDVEGKKVRRVFATEAEARGWRVDSLSRRRRGLFMAPGPQTVREAAAALLGDMRSGVARTRSGDPYKPSTIRGYDEALRVHVLGDVGGLKLARLTRRHVQALADGMVAAGAGASTIRNALMPLRVIVRRALETGDLLSSPFDGVRLPVVRGRRDRVVSPQEARTLIRALPATLDRAVWGCAFYAGLRRGEILGLERRDVDLASGVIRVERSMDVPAKRIVAPKSRAGVRRVPVAAVLRELLVDYTMERPGLAPDARLFSFDPGSFAARANRSWATQEPPLRPVELHEARHTAASLWIAAGIDPKALQTYMGHSSITTTFDLYGHLMPGSETAHAAMLDAYLERADTQARLAAISDAPGADSDAEGRTQGRT